MRLSVTARIALLSIALALLSNIAVLAFVRHQARADALEGVHRDTAGEMDALFAAYRGGGAVGLRAAVDDASGEDPATVIALVDAGGRRIAGGGPDLLTIPRAATHFRIGPIAAAPDWTQDYGYAVRPIAHAWLLVGQELGDVEDQQRALERALLIGVVVAIAFGILGGVIVSRYVARRLARISGVIAAVGKGDLSHRVEFSPLGHDAFDRLAMRLNTTLDKVEALMTELRVVTDGLAHDLRSPLARLRAKTEQAVLLPEGAAREAALGGLLAETDLILRMLTMSIEISRSGQVSRDRFTMVEPAALIEQIADLYGPVAEDAGVEFAVKIEGTPAPHLLHRELVSQAITNLLDNALKHAAAGRYVALRLRDAPDALTIDVADRGPGIAAADRAVALSRFGRLDSARSVPGAGLGMSLIEAVARLHGGSFALLDAAPGLIARIVLPRGVA